MSPSDKDTRDGSGSGEERGDHWGRVFGRGIKTFTVTWADPNKTRRIKWMIRAQDDDFDG